MSEVRAVLRRAEAMAASIRGFRRREARPVAFRLNYGEGRSATLGIHDSKVGSVYAPFQLSEGVRGLFLVAWQDGRISRGTIDGNQGPDLGELLEASYDTRYDDPDARRFAGPARIPAVPIAHPALRRILDGRFGLLYDAVDLICARGRALRVKKVSGSAQVSQAANVILTSRGLRYAGVSGEASFAFGYDAELWDGRSRRRPFTLGEVGRVIDRAAQLLPALRREVRNAPSGPSRVLFLPGFTADMLEAYLFGNLHGADVATGQSAFKPEEFRRRTRKFRPDLVVRVDPTVPYSSGSFRITSEGLPARLTTYVAGGRLLRPIVGLKFARRLRMRPTTPPASMESVYIEMGQALSEKAALAALGDGYAVLSALGLHTQDRASGDFSLTAPRALAVRGGRYAGVTKAVLAGNFFAALADDRTRLVRIAGTRLPGLLVDCSVTAG